MNTEKQHFQSLSLCWALCLSLFGMVACDDEPIKPESYELSFILPEADSILGCADDLKRSTPNEIDIAVSLSAQAPASELDNLVIELSAMPSRFEAQRRALTDDGRVIFSDLALSAGNYEFEAKLLNGELERASATLAITVEIDPESPLCGVNESSISFINPVEGTIFTASDDLDNDLTNGVQVPVEIEVNGPVANLSNLVEVEVNGGNPVRTQVENGKAFFESVTLPLSGTHELRAFTTGPNGLLEASVSVEVNASECELILSPAPMDGCDIGATADVDPDRPGLQAELKATSDCEQVIWTVNGQSYTPATVVDGEASLVVTLNNGENTISARAQSENGLGANVDTYVLDVDTTDPELSIDQFEEIGVNRRNLSQAITSFNAQGEAILKWRINGFTSNLPANSEVRLTIEPPLENAPETLTLDGQGRFTIELEGDYLCGHQITISGDDQCGGVHQTPSYSFCFDGVTPRLSIVDPAQLELINTDIDPENEGLQTQFTIRVEDQRESEDYPIEIHCARGEGGSSEVLSISSVLRSELSAVEGESGVYQGPIFVSFPRADTYSCKPVAMTGQNEPVLASSFYPVITDEPIFEILDPIVAPNSNGRTYACFSDLFFIGGEARQFSEGNTELNYTLYSEGGQVARFGQLQAQDSNFYSTSLDLTNQQLADGRYSLVISGTSGGVDISVIPSDPIEVLIDNEVPVVGPLNPANGSLTLANDQNSDLSDCIQSSVEFSLSDESAERVCFSLNGSLPTCTDQVAQGIVRTPSYNFIPGENTINMQVIDCAGASSEFDFTLNAEGCQAPLRVTNWSDGSGVTLLNDIDNETEGLQISLSLSGNANEIVNFELNVNAEPSMIVGPLTLDSLGLGELAVTLPTSLDGATEIILTPVSEQRRGQSLNLTSYEIRPLLSVRPLSDVAECLNNQVQDRSSAPGFQMRFEVDADALAANSIPQVQVYCQLPGNDQRELVDEQNGAVINLGQSALITFSTVTLPDGQCDLEFVAMDVSGLPMSQQFSLTVDRTPPEVELVLPAPDTILDLLDDNDGLVPGIQFPTRVRVCGAAGQVMTVATIPAQSEEAITNTLGEEECETVDLGLLTYTNGSQLLTATVSDACGNTQEFSQNIEGDTNVSIVIIEPRDQALINRSEDQDLETAGCQIEVDVRSAGFTDIENVEFALCASNQAGALSPLCGNQSDASQGQCSTSAQGNNIRCPITLSDGQHDISLVARENGVDLRSNTISILSDCTAPNVVEISIAEDLNDDQCINAQERINASASSRNASFTVDFQVNGIEDNRLVRVFSLPGQVPLGSVEISEGRGSISNVNLPQGEHFIYLAGTDVVGNSLPNQNDESFAPLVLLIDTEAPTPELLRPMANQCLNIADDLEPQAGAQYQPQVSSGWVEGEPVSLSLGLDGIIVQRETVSNPTFTFSTILLSEGNHLLSLVAEDSCGNAGSVAGFNTIGDRPDWSAPLSVPISVDLSAPTLVLNGVDDGQTLLASDDANQSPADGFQVNVSIDATGLEAGQELKIYSGEERLPTLPAQLITTVADSQTLTAVLTLPPGPHALSVRSEDACENPSTSQAKNIDIAIDGCSSQITSLISGQLLGPNQGIVTADNKLRLDISGRVDLLDPQCASAQAELLLDGSELLGSTTIDQSTGDIVFSEVTIPEGEHSVSTRIRLNNEVTSSLGKNIRVDLIAPSSIVITSPALNAEGVRQVLQDNDPEAAGQQMTLVATVTEAPSTSSRSARISIDGVQLPLEISVDDPAPNEDTVELRITGLNPPAREASYQLCISDEAQNERCQSFTIIADPSAPTGITLNPTVMNKRIPEVEVSFTAPGDDQSGGDRVQAYEARWSFNNINSELTWESARLLNELIPSVQPGAIETLSIENLPPNKSFYLSLRARDDVGRLGAVRSALIDTRLNRATVNFNPRSGNWDSTQPTFTTGNALNSIGDFDGDGYDDLMVNSAQSVGQDFISDVLIIKGMDDLSVLNSNTLALNIPVEMSNLLFGIEVTSGGDVNGDGAPDIVVAGYPLDFNGSAFAVYFGCPLAQNCTNSELATADSVIFSPGHSRVALSNRGDLVQGLAVGCDDIVLGGGFDPSFNYNTFVTIIEGRSQWPAVIQDVVTPSVSDGYYKLTSTYNNAGVQVSTAGDLDGDGTSELIFSAGDSIDHLHLVYGGSTLETALATNGGELTFDGTNPDFIEVDNPCAELGPTSFGTMLRGGVDLNGDDNADFVVGNASDKLMVVMSSDLQQLDCFRRGENRFGSRFDLAGDINGDGFIDLIANNEDNTLSNAEQVFVFYNDGNASFGSDQVTVGRGVSLSASAPSGQKIATSGAGDMNDDGKDDFAVLSYDQNILKVTIYH